MAKTKISNGDLTALFWERLKQSSDCPLGVSVAIIPLERSGWRALIPHLHRRKYPACAKRVEAIEKQLKAAYNLAED